MRWSYPRLPHRVLQSDQLSPQYRRIAGPDEEDEGMTNASNVINYETGNHVESRGSTICKFAGEYRTGQFRRDIRLDAEVENWTSTTTNPTLPEKLLIRVKPANEGIALSGTSNYGDDLKYRIRVNIDYLVEFKELKDGLRWPVQRQPVTVTIANTVTSTN